MARQSFLVENVPMYIRMLPATYKGDFSWDETNFLYGKIQREFDYLTSSNVITNERSEF